MTEGPTEAPKKYGELFRGSGAIANKYPGSQCRHFFFKFIFGQILVPRGTIYKQGRGSGGIEPDPDSNLVKKRIRPTKKPTEIWPHT